MHFDVSISLATGVNWRAGGAMLEAERRMRSCGPNCAAEAWTDGLGSGGNMARLLCYRRPSDGLDVDQKRLVFRRLDVGVADIGCQRVGAEPFPGRAGESPMQR